MNIAKIASVHDLQHLKHVHPAASIQHGDISPLINQNCDAAGRVLCQQVITELEQYVPGSEATQLYLQAEVWMHAPYRSYCGSPYQMTRSLWAGLMTFRRWRQFIILSGNLKLSCHFISRLHYVTIELIVHAAINHFLCLFLCFPSIPFTQYSLRNTGNRSLEALHGTFRGGTCSLPITSCNLSFRECLEKMNPIIATKKKRSTFAVSASENVPDHTCG